MHRIFSKEELAFFAVPRNWPEIDRRFPSKNPDEERDLRDAIIHADDDGGIGFIRWHQDKMSWCLTDRGKNWVGAQRVTEGKNWKQPSEKKDASVMPDDVARLLFDDEP